MNATLRTQKAHKQDFGNDHRFCSRRILNSSRHILADGNKVDVAHTCGNGHNGDDCLPHIKASLYVGESSTVRSARKRSKRPLYTSSASTLCVVPRPKDPPDTAKLGRAVILLAAKLAEDNSKPGNTAVTADETPKENDDA
jgi:hypothetical protein